MIPAASNSTSSTAGFWHWSSPVPYLFGGLALMLAVITVALVILACSYRRAMSREGTDPAEKTGGQQVEIMVDSDEPKIVVIMAGDENPTYLAKPKPKPQPDPVVCTCQKIEQV